jgi:hypothetical protein
MSFFSIRQAFAALCVAVLVSACGGNGSSAPPPAGGITVTPGDGTATVTWTSVPDVKYWLFYAPSTSITSTDWINIPGSRALLNVTSPYVVTGLANGYVYSFAVNARNGDGPGGAGTPSVSVVPRPAGEFWTPGSALGSNTIRNISYGTGSDQLGYYFAVGDAGSTYRSTDGKAWTALPSAANSNLNASIFTFSKFIAVGSGGTITYGTDMSAWTAAASNTTEALNAIASNGVLAVAVGNNGTAIKSADGITWTAVAMPTTRHLRSIIYSSNGIWVAVGAGGALLTSPDGSAWTAVASGTSVDLNAVSVQIVTSYTFLAVGNGGTIIRSTDNCITWTTQSSGTTADLFAVSPASSQLMTVGSGGAILTSPDGITWTRRSTGTTANLYSVISGLAQYVAVGQGGTSLVSK